jgi:putative SOS response-associated peptidase YedK
VLVDTLYEWQKAGTGKQPYAIGLKGGGLMALAGLWETWRSCTSGERVRGFAIVTTVPNELCAALHNRMAVVLAPEAWPAGSARSRRRGAAEIAAGPLPVRRHGPLAGQPTRRQRQERRSGSGGAD